MSVVQSKTKKVPTYLGSFSLDLEELLLIYAKKPSVHLPFENSAPSLRTNSETYSEESTTLDECDLTGAPLEVDLGGADDTVLDVKSEECKHLWPSEETKHFPLSLLEARKLLSEYGMNNPISGIKNKSLPAFAICDGQDRESTVILGAGSAKDPMFLKIRNLGCLTHEEAFDRLEAVMKNHVKQARSKSVEKLETKCSVQIKYDLYGTSLKQLQVQNASMRNSEKHANVSVDVSCRKCVITPSETDTNLKTTLNLEIIAGHKLLSVHSFWKELCHLQTLLDLIWDPKSASDEDTILCQDPWEPKKIFQKISILVTSGTSRHLTKRTGIDIDFENLRELDILDKAWNIVRNCETLYILRESIHHLFEEIYANERNMPLPDNDSNIAIVVNGIMRKNMVLTQFSFSQTLNFLYEMGVRKLKKDYQAVLTHFCPSAKSTIDSVFSSLFSKYSLSQDGMRRTTLIQNGKDNNLESLVEQLAYLSQLHVATEFIFLVKEQVNLLEKSFDHFCKTVCQEYVKNATKITDFSEIYQSPLKTMSFDLFSKEIRIVQSLHPVTWTAEMKSTTTGNTQVVTVYHLSQTPIFPPVMVNYVPDVESDTTMIYYAALMQKRVGFF